MYSTSLAAAKICLWENGLSNIQHLIDKTLEAHLPVTVYSEFMLLDSISVTVEKNRSKKNDHHSCSKRQVAKRKSEFDLAEDRTIVMEFFTVLKLTSTCLMIKPIIPLKPSDFIQSDDTSEVFRKCLEK